MHSSKALSEPVGEVVTPAAILRGTARGLEVVVDGRAPVEAIAEAVLARLDEAPGFFRGSDVRVRVEDGPLASGCLARLDDIATRFALRIVEVSAVRNLTDSDAVPKSASLAAGSAPAATQFDDEGPTQSAALVVLPEVVEPAPHLEPITLASCDLTELVELVEEPSPTFDEPTQTAVPLALAVTAELELEPSSGTR